MSAIMFCIACLSDSGPPKADLFLAYSTEASSEAWAALERAQAAEDEAKRELQQAQRELEKKREGMVVSAFQAFAALDAAGYLDQVETMMADPETPRVHRLAFEKAQEFRRTSDTVNAWKERLELTEQQVDELFEHAATIVA